MPDHVYKSEFLRDMHWRGQISQITSPQEFDAHLCAGPAAARKAYAGFDPTADSLTIGNLVTIMALVRFAKAGHTPIVVVGGGTGLIGDPSGKSAERQLLTPERVDQNVQGQRRIFDAIWRNAGLGTPPIRNNYEWLKNLSYLDALRDVGKYFSVNMMIQKDSVKDRLHNRDQGISYTEFSYMILQAYDYHYLWKESNVTLQMGGSDQFGNIVCGLDLIKRHASLDAEAKGLADAPRVDAFGLTWPLITKADGGKFGKTESGAVWLTPDRTSPFAFYQFWLNSADADIPKFLRTFTLLPHAEIEQLEAAHASDPAKRDAHRALARHMTTLLHGQAATDDAEAAAKTLFSGEVAGLPEATLREVFSQVPATEHDKATLAAGVPILDLLVTTKLAASKREAKEFLAGGSVLINGTRKATADGTLTPADLLHGSMILIRRGKKNWHLTSWK
ncbi:MAG: tyrosine--tRNA ligase [Tepidisphaera sp.]|nr:tyrosine--tRNA ligase [Tepidisphaera sp.]